MLAPFFFCAALAIRRCRPSSCTFLPRYGAGRWRVIQKDPVFGAVLATRSNVDLKVCVWVGARERASLVPTLRQRLSSDPHQHTQDKWRNLTMDSSRGSRGRRGAARRLAAAAAAATAAAAALAAGVPPPPPAPAPPPARGRKRPPRRAPDTADAAPLDALYALQEAALGADPGATLARRGEGDASTSTARGRRAGSAGAGFTADDLVVAAIVSLADPSGSSAEAVCGWVAAHTAAGAPPPPPGELTETLDKMAAAGRLEFHPGRSRGGVYRLGGLVPRLAAAAPPPGARRRASPPVPPPPRADDPVAISAAAASAAAAVREAEAAAALASRLLGSAAALRAAADAEAARAGPADGDGGRAGPPSTSHAAPTPPLMTDGGGGSGSGSWAERVRAEVFQPPPSWLCCRHRRRR